MNNINSLVSRDLKHIWHPCSQMKDYESLKPIVVKSASGSYIKDINNNKIIDAISSWWCKSLGHNHPRLKKALLQQIDKFEHVIFVNTTNDIIVELSETLTNLTQNLNKVFYAGDGSSAVEIAMKMSLHNRKILNEGQRTNFIALKNSYHGETVGALSVSDVGIFKDPYQEMLFKTHFINNIPYVNSSNNQLWQNCEQQWQLVESSLEPFKENTTAIIIEPIVQGAGGMKIYSQDFLKRLRTWTTKNNVHLIADEIMTGIGRTGTMFACNHANIEPDFLCLSKGLTSGWLPFSAVLTTNKIYDAFYDDYENAKSFLHSHTYSGNVLGAVLALNTLKIIQEENICANVIDLNKIMFSEMLEIQNSVNKISKNFQLTNLRHIGAIIAIDIIKNDESKMNNNNNINENSDQRVGFTIYKEAVKLGALLRPLGNTIYWLPPLNTNVKTIKELAQITKNAILSVLN